MRKNSSIKYKLEKLILLKYQIRKKVKMSNLRDDKKSVKKR
jgi:hypothetical protein